MEELNNHKPIRVKNCKVRGDHMPPQNGCQWRQSHVIERGCPSSHHLTRSPTDHQPTPPKKKPKSRPTPLSWTSTRRATASTCAAAS
jgi:hypothetical protein